MCVCVFVLARMCVRECMCVCLPEFENVLEDTCSCCSVSECVRVCSVSKCVRVCVRVCVCVGCACLTGECSCKCKRCARVIMFVCVCVCVCVKGSKRCCWSL